MRRSDGDSKKLEQAKHDILLSCIDAFNIQSYVSSGVSETADPVCVWEMTGVETVEELIRVICLLVKAE